MTQLRRSASSLNYDLFKVNLVANPKCRCGSEKEDRIHYFFGCPFYHGIRNILFEYLNSLNIDIDIKLITSGSELLSEDENDTIFKHVFEFIKKTERFQMV